NDIWCDMFFAAPVGMSVAAYRLRHISHHAHLGTEKDADGYPYREPIKGFRALAWVMVKALSGGMGVCLAADKYGGSARKATASSPLPPFGPNHH
ncbi:fatty acid desaturase, partial [Rhizobium ruizarguesonis]